jgi:hypothetical protein
VDLQVDTKISEEHTASIFTNEVTQYFSPELWYLPASPHAVATQKTNVLPLVFISSASNRFVSILNEHES